MKKMILIAISFMACLYLAGCGTPDRYHQGRIPPTGKTQAADTAQKRNVQNSKIQQSIEDTAVLQEKTQYSQTEWDGQEEKRKEIPIKAEESTEENGGTETASNEDTVEFMGVDSNKILSCTLYHGEGKEEIDLTEARGKCLLQMLDDLFKDSNYTYSIAEGIFDPKYEILENMAKSRKNAYFIYIELGKNITYPLPGATLKNFNTIIIEGNTQPYTEANGQTHDAELLLYYNIENEDYFYYASSPLQEQELAEDFMSGYREWEQAEDWDAALEKLKEGHK